MSSPRNLRFFAFLALLFASACGRQTVTESLLSGDQSLVETIEVEASRSEGEKFASVTVATSQPNLAQQTNITLYAGRSLKDLKPVVPAEQLLSPYAEDAAYSMSERNGPNCWHTSIAAIFKKWTERRYMHDDEFSCHVTTWFREVKDPKFGDLIRFLDSDGQELHGATFIGMDKDSQEAVVFTKNGYSKVEGWGFMTFADLKEVYSEVSSVKFYAPIQEAVEPVESGTKCHREYLQSKAFQSGM